MTSHARTIAGGVVAVATQSWVSYFRLILSS